MSGAVVSLIASHHDDYSGDLANSTLYGLGGISEAIATMARSGVQSAPALYEGGTCPIKYAPHRRILWMKQAENTKPVFEFDDGLIEPSKEWSATSSTC